MLLVGVGGEGSTAARPVLERGGGGFAGERADVGIQAAADLARVDDDDLAGAACLGVTVQVDLEPAVLKGGVVRHVRVLLHKLEQLLLQFLVLAERLFAVDVVPGDVVDIRQRHILAAVDVRQTAVVRLGVVRDGVAGELHDFPTHIDDITALGCTAGGLDVDTEHGALDGLAGVGHAERVAVAADFAHNGRGGALLHLADGGTGVGVGQAARKRRGRYVA